LDETVRLAIIKMCKVFQKICEKEIQVDDCDNMMQNVIMAICVLELEFLPTFLNVMTHLPLHLVEQLFICGPVHCRWMYPIERYLNTLKDYVRTYARPEESIAEGYYLEDTLGFCTEYMTRYKATMHRVWDTIEEPTMNDEVLRQNVRLMRKMTNDFRNYIYAFVIVNAPSMEPLRE